jgi:hypothetical protein
MALVDIVYVVVLIYCLVQHLRKRRA